MKNLFLRFLLSTSLYTTAFANSLDELIMQAYMQNPDMQLARAALITSLQNQRYVGSWENPELNLNLKDDSLGNDEGEGSFEIEFTQDVSFTAAKQKEKALSNAQSSVVAARYKELARNTAHQLELLVIDLSKVQESLLLQDSFANLYTKAQTLLNDQILRGEASPLDLTQVTLSKTNVEQQMNVLKIQQRNILLKIRLMLNSSEELTLDYPLKADKEIHLPELIPPFKSPAFQIEQAIYTEAERRLDLATANRWNDVSVHLFGEQEKSSDAKDELEENTLLGIGISIKLPFWNQNTATIQQAKSARDLSKHRQAILAESINLSIMNAQENLTQSHRLCLQSNGQILTLAEQNHQAFQDAYLQGQASLVQVQRAQELQLELKNKALDSLVNYYRAKAELRYLLNDYPTLQLPE